MGWDTQTLEGCADGMAARIGQCLWNGAGLWGVAWGGGWLWGQGLGYGCGQEWGCGLDVGQEPGCGCGQEGWGLDVGVAKSAM